MTSKTEKRLLNAGWSKDEAKWRSEAIDHAHAAAKSLAHGIEPLSLVGVVVRDHTGRETIREGFVTCERRLSVGGVLGVNIVSVATKPYRLVGGDDWTIGEGGMRARLADGTDVYLGEQTGGVYCYVAAGKTFPSIAAAALELTPA